MRRKAPSERRLCNREETVEGERGQDNVAWLIMPVGESFHRPPRVRKQTERKVTCCG